MRDAYHPTTLPVPDPSELQSRERAGQASAHTQDVTLAQRAFAGDRAAIDELASRLRCIGRILAARNARAGRVLTAEDLEDLGQEVVVSIWAQLPSYRGIGPIEAWTHSYCDHAFRNAARKRGHAGRVFREIADESKIPDRHASNDGPDAGLQVCLDRLSAADQWVIHKKHYDCATLEEIAAESEMNLNTLKSRYTRALQQLRQCLAGKSA
ncbi:MAG TPA: RNA polymerase sigma factor [Planctomycetota bacterium]